MDLVTALKSERIACWYHSVGQLGVSNVHWKQERFLDNCIDEMHSFLEVGDYLGMTKVAAKYYKRASCDRLKDYVANAWDRYVTVLYFMGVDTPQLDLLEV